MPELPDVLLYVSSLGRLLKGRRLKSAIIRSPSLLKTFRPDLSEFESRRILDFSRCGKRVVWEFEDDMHLVFHLMIAGRFHWKTKKSLPKSKNDLAAFSFDCGTMMLTEASSHKRAGLWCLEGRNSVDALDAGGIDVTIASTQDLRDSLLRSNNTLKRALADPRRFDGIGNAYSDEILWEAQLSPLKRTKQLTDLEINRLIDAMRSTLLEWTQRLQEQTGSKFPENVTAFRPEMVVHGKFGKACMRCEAPVQRIRYANNECNYCPGCQTDGRILADRSLSRLLKDDWPNSLEDLEDT